MTTDDKPAPTNPLSLVNTHWLHRADQRVRIIVDVNKSGGFVMSVSERIDIVETVADLATLEADWERVKWMPGWFTEAEAAKLKPRTIRDGLVPLGPEDTYNGVKVSSFCMACRDGIARYEHGMQAGVELCAEDSAKVVGAMSSVHVVGDKPSEFYRMAHAAVGADPAIEHPAPWLWEAVSDFTARDTGEKCYTAIGLADARGTPIISVNSSDTLDISSPFARTLIAAAPEMEALLREFHQGCFTGFEGAPCVDREGGEPACGKCDGCRTDALLARLDAAKVA